MEQAMATINGNWWGETLNGTNSQDFIFGFGGDDILYGFAGNDHLDGGDGDDRLWGGIGDDLLVGGNNGWWGWDELYGGSGNDLLDGGLGHDRMYGETGNDLYVVDHVEDAVIENVNEGIDTVHSYLANYWLPANVEHLSLVGSGLAGYGNGMSNTLAGNAFNNTLVGYAGNDWLDGGGGADYLEGGLHDDTYVVDNAGDIVIEYAGEGYDKIYSSVSLTLGVHFEELILTGSAPINGTGHDWGSRITGNSANNVLTGGRYIDFLYGGGGDDTLYGIEHFNYLYGESGNDTIYGGIHDDDLNGGSGTDYMAGGRGNDHYWVDDAGDVVVENEFDPGYDSVNLMISNADYLLPAHVEKLWMFNLGPMNGTGNGMDNFINGNAWGNTLDGAGGADEIHGGYHNSGGAPDDDDQLHGSAGNDRLFGESGNDMLWGGADVDVLAGGTGIDRFYFAAISESALGAPDQIADFSSHRFVAQGDKIDVSAIDANVNIAGDQAFVFIGNNNAFFGAGQVRCNGGFVEGDVDGDGNADFRIQVFQTDNLLIEADFLL
jgi:Ca2+-binding RTX toxin-like protein